MRTREIELAKPGIFGSEDNPQIVSVTDLKEIVETFPDIQKAPISLTGHWPDPAKPRLANVIAVRWDETTQSLWGTVEEHDALAKAVDEGFYPDRSIGSKRRASDGKMYLHHLAYLGEEPPAIKDLIEQILGSLEAPTPEEIAASDGGEEGGIIIPPASQALSLHDVFTSRKPVPAVPAKKAPKQTPKEGKIMTIEEIKADPEKAAQVFLELSDQATAQQKTLEALATKYPEEELLLSDRADPRVTQLQNQLKQGKAEGLRKAAVGKVPKGQLGLVDALAGRLSMSEDIELSDGTTKTKVDGFTLLGRIFESIPSPVKPGMINLGDPAEGGIKYTPADSVKGF